MINVNYLTRKYASKAIGIFNYVVEKPLLTSTVVLGLVTVVVTSLSLPYYISQPEAFWTQILAEAHGMIFDIAVIGILLFWLNQIA